MTTAYTIHHVTHFAYERPVSFARCNLRLKPIDWAGQRLLTHRITVTPDGRLTDANSRSTLLNITRLLLSSATRSLDIVSHSRVTVDRAVPMPSPADPTVSQVGSLARESHDIADSAPANFLYPSPLISPDAAIAGWCAESLDPERPVVEAVLELALRIMRDFRFDPDATKTETRPAEAFAKRAGVCQDFAQIMICGLRAAGLPAAYASGYIRTIPPKGQERLQGADAMHGWVLVWCGPDRGWVGFDPTNGIFMAGDHIIVAVGRDYRDIAPVDGIFTGYGAQNMRVAVDVLPD
ncbi:MAG: transglutaminase family protein [Pseudomonadota bacterium]